MPRHWDDPLPPLPWDSKPDPERFERIYRQYRDTPADGIVLGKSQTSSLPVYIRPKQLSTHLHIVGATNVGKSYFLEGILKELILAGHGICLIDPHGDLYHRLLDFCTYFDQVKPELKLSRRVIPFDVAETNRVLGFNPVARNARVMTYQVVALMEAIRKVWGQATFQDTPRLARWLFNAAYAVVDSKLTLLQARHLLDTKNNEYRPAIIERIQNPDIKAEWQWLSAIKDDKREERTESCFNRIRLFVNHEIIRPIIGQTTRTIDFPEVLAGRKILLVNLSGQHVISDNEQQLLGTLIVNELLTAAFARPKDQRQPFYLAIDEFQHFVTKDICEILDGGRKFGLHLILAHQLLHQLKAKDPEVYYSTLTNARTKVVFGGMNDEDLDILARELFTGEFNPDEIKDETWQTKFKPVETTRTITAFAESDSYGESDSDSSGEVTHKSLAAGESYIPGSGLWTDALTNASRVETRGSSASSGRSSSRSSNHSSSTTTTEVPWYEYHEFSELSSRTFRSLEEQLYIKKAQLKRQQQQHAAVLIPGKYVQLIKTMTLRDLPVNESAREEFRQACFERAGCFKPFVEASLEVDTLEQRLLEASPSITVEAGTETTERKPQPGVQKSQSRRRTKPKKPTPYDPILNKPNDE
jgi:Helicase HerA, central domain/TraM recognition site of TraD and TraG